MSAPVPLSGHNPYTLGYQKRQFGAGRPQTTPQPVFDDLVSPPATGVTAEGQNPLVERAEFLNLTPQTITVNGNPTSFSFKLAYEGIPTTATFTQASVAADLQAALVALSTIGAGKATVSGDATDGWVVHLTLTPPLSLLTVQSTSFVGGNRPSITVDSPAKQPGIVPY
jgi:hypothetical protein